MKRWRSISKDSGGGGSELDYIDAKNDFNDLGEPVGGEDNKETQDSSSEAGLTGVGRFGITGGGEHLETTPDEHAEENETGDDHDVGQ